MKPHPLIEQLDKQAREKEGVFFAHIANRLGRDRITEKPVQPVRGVPDFWREYNLGEQERIELFMRNWESLGGTAKRFATKEEIAAFIDELAHGMSAKQIIRAKHGLLEEMKVDEKLSDLDMTIWEKDSPADLLAKAAGADIGITVVDFAVAHTGSVVVTSSPEKGRSLSLLPTIFIAIVPAGVIKTKMGEVMREVTKWNQNGMPAGIHFISGPSRSADIENDLTIGVHGPGIVYALVLDEK
ncbi:LutC/YkgG family protein [Brevibacillus dissolubilis]|uniref:LutC/YkgG family protein n=1 Tax=Brevibacillus dissolubilis TaxID=1844116 RepID=UPI001116BF51|nr:lactate utilization protein C [Brevibacillus dissolubilis]